MTALAFPKPEPPIFQRRRRQAERRAHEDQVRRLVRARDGSRCRVPGCREPGECAHIDPKKMGGDHGERTDTTNCFMCCRAIHHRGSRGSIHSGDLEVIKLTKAGCDGPLAFHWRLTGQVIKERECRRQAK